MKLKFATSTIDDGNMAFKYGPKDEVLRNRQKFLDKLGLPVENAVVMYSRHEALLQVVDKSTAKENIGLRNSLLADALITQMSNTPLLLTTADCLPMCLWDEITSTVALVHVSRHTFELDLIEKTLAAVEKLGVHLENTKVFIGPHIHKSSYSFSLPLNKESEKLKPYIEKQTDKAYIDLAGAAIKTLAGLGVVTDNITISSVDTRSDSKHFSHVEAKQKDLVEGRLISVVCLADV